MKLESNGEAALVAALKRGQCPDCQGKRFLAGPRGGWSQNIKCANPGCGRKFNITRYGGKLIFAQRIDDNPL